MRNFITTVFFLSAQLAIAQNVGIGTNTPIVKLDVAGRLRLQQNGQQTAGIFFDGTIAPQRSFIGTIDNDHVGIFGAGAGWKFAFNVTNGYVGVGIPIPTATLDVNGSLRIRQAGAGKGSTLVAQDALGNAEWQAPIAFRVLGYSYGAHINFPHDTWTDINFGTNIDYNYGNGYNSGVSEFIAPKKGIYHFTSQLYFNATSEHCSQRLLYKRNGISTVASIVSYSTGFEQEFWGFTSLLNVDIELEAGDAVRIEGLARDFDGSDSRQISGNGTNTWWSGRLVTVL